MTILKHPSGYTIISNSLLFDKGLTVNSKYIMSILLSLPADWEYNLTELSTFANLGRETVRAALRLLAERKYIKIIDRHIEGKEDIYNYELFYEPYSEVTDIVIVGEPKKKSRKVIAKKKYADYVALSDDEYKKLAEKFGESELQEWIEKMDSYQKSTGKRYADAYQTILNWAKKEHVSKEPVQKKQEPVPKIEMVELPLERFAPYWIEAEIRRGDMTKFGWSHREVYEAAKLINWDSDLEFEKKQFYLRLDGLI